MTKREATLELVWTVFKGLPVAGRREIVRRLLSDKRFREDLIDTAIIQARRNEPRRPFREYLKSSRRRAAKSTD